MSALKTQQAIDAAHVVQEYAQEVENEQQFMTDVAMLVLAAMDEGELRLMRGETRHLGEKHMLLSSIYNAISLTSRPVQREASYQMVKEALDKYLNITIGKRPRKRRRRKLLPHV